MPGDAPTLHSELAALRDRNPIIEPSNDFGWGILDERQRWRAAVATLLSKYSESREAERRAFVDVLAERKRQDAKWGEQNHDPFLYLAVLMEEVGELAQAALHLRFGGEAAEKIRDEAVHSAAVGLAIVECLDRDKWEWGSHALPRLPDAKEV